MPIWTLMVASNPKMTRSACAGDAALFFTPRALSDEGVRSCAKFFAQGESKSNWSDASPEQMVLTRYDNQGRTHKAARKALSAECILYAVQNHKGNCRSFGRLPEVGIFSISWWLVSSNLGHLEEILLRVDSNSLRGSGFSQVWAGHFAIHQEALAQGLLCESDHLHPTGSNGIQLIKCVRTKETETDTIASFQVYPGTTKNRTWHKSTTFTTWTPRVSPPSPSPSPPPPPPPRPPPPSSSSFFSFSFFSFFFFCIEMKGP